MLILSYSLAIPAPSLTKARYPGAEKKSGVPYILTSEVGIAKRPNQNMK